MVDDEKELKYFTKNYKYKNLKIESKDDSTALEIKNLVAYKDLIVGTGTTDVDDSCTSILFYNGKKEEITNIKGLKEVSINYISLINKGKKLITGGSDKKLKIWDVESVKMVNSIDIESVDDVAEIKCFSGNNKSAVVATDYGKCINLVSLVGKGKVLKTLYPSGDGILHLESFANPNLTIVTALAHSINVWDGRNAGKLMNTIQIGGCVRSMAINKTNEYIYVGSTDKHGLGILTIVSTSTWEKVQVIRQFKEGSKKKFNGIENIYCDEEKLIFNTQTHSNKQSAANGEIHFWTPYTGENTCIYKQTLNEGCGSFNGNLCVSKSSIYAIDVLNTRKGVTKAFGKWKF